MTAIDELPGIDRATVIPRDGHTISRKQIAPNALKVLYRLGDNGYGAFLVGGCIRDLLLGNHPKDFDVATDATPEQVKDLFRNARIIGRRFKIVHIRFGREIIEVTTFRAPHEDSTEVDAKATRRQIADLDSAHSNTGMLLRDNVYGNIDDDALRRDFTVNALYYSTDRFRVFDFCSGLEDLQARKIRMIGEPASRYREDPVRMLRAIRFSAKLEFEIEPGTLEPIDQLAHLLESVSPARLFDETLKLMTSGHACRAFALLRESQIGMYLFGPTLEALPNSEDCAGRLVELALENTDERLSQGKSVTPAFLFAALLWPVLQLRLKQNPDPELPPRAHFHRWAGEVISEQLALTAIPKRFTITTREIWDLQQRLEKRNRRSVQAVFNHPRFRAAYDFLLLREAAGEQLNGLGDWWTRFQEADTQARGEMVAALTNTGKRPRRRRRRKPASDKQ